MAASATVATPYGVVCRERDVAGNHVFFKRPVTSNLVTSPGASSPTSRQVTPNQPVAILTKGRGPELGFKTPSESPGDSEGRCR